MDELAIPIHSKDHILGNFEAPVTLLEYADYECPFCGPAYLMVKELQEQLGDKIRYAYRQFPLTQIHPHAYQASLATEAAAIQGKFWQMHDILYENPEQLEVENLVRYVQVIKLDLMKFLKDIESEQVSEKIEHDYYGGIESGVNGTPTFFINGKRVNGSYGYESLLEEINKEIEKNTDK